MKTFYLGSNKVLKAFNFSGHKVEIYLLSRNISNFIPSEIKN